MDYLLSIQGQDCRKIGDGVQRTKSLGMGLIMGRRLRRHHRQEAVVSKPEQSTAA